MAHAVLVLLDDRSVRSSHAPVVGYAQNAKLFAIAPVCAPRRRACVQRRYELTIVALLDTNARQSPACGLVCTATTEPAHSSSRCKTLIDGLNPVSYHGRGVIL